MSNRGSYVTLMILVLAVASAVFAWGYRQAHSRQALQFWGGQTASLIRRAPQIELWQLQPSEQTSAAVQVEGQGWDVVQQVDLATAPGVLHLRQALLEDDSFHWERPPRGSRNWDYALRFADNQQQAVVLIDLQQEWVQLQDGKAPAHIGPIADGLRTFLAEQFAPELAPAASPVSASSTP